MWAHLRLLRVQPGAWLADRVSRSRYPTLDEGRLRASLTSQTCFVFGSGSSLDDITAKEWEIIARHHTIGFNYFIRSRFVRVDFHVVGEMASSDDLDPKVWRPVVAEYAECVEGNPFYANTILGLQEGFRALQSNRLSSGGGLRPERRVFRYRRIGRGERRPPALSLSEGLVHGAGTLMGCVNLAFILGFSDIVVVGVDLYDRRAFARLERPAVGGGDPRHATAEGIVRSLGDWGHWMRARGVALSVYNPRSLLAQVLPVRARMV